MDWTEFATALGTQIVPILATLLVAIITALVSVGLSHLKAWTGVKITDVQRDMVTQMASEGVTYAEEQALKALKKCDKTPDSDTKMELAVNYVVGQMKASGLPAMAENELVKLIESNLMFQRPTEDMASSKQLPFGTVSKPDGEA